MGRYEIEGQVYDTLVEADALQLPAVLKRMPTRVFCLCHDPKRISMTYRHTGAGDMYIRRHDGDGALHARSCKHCLITPEEAAGMGYSPAAMAIDDDGIRVISLATALNIGSKTPNTKRTTFKFPTGAKRRVYNRVTLLGLLHYIWEIASLNQVRPGYLTNLWPRVRRASHTVRPRRLATSCGFGDFLLLPLHSETPSQDSYNWKKLDEAHKKRRNILFIAKFTSAELTALNLNPSNTVGFSLKSHFGHAVKLYKDDTEAVLKRFCRSFRTELGYVSQGADAVLFGVAEPDTYKSSLYARIKSLVLMPVVQGSVPFESAYEKTFIDYLVSANRRFTKPLKYDVARFHGVHPDFVLTDRASPIVVEIYGMATPDYLARKKEKEAIYAAQYPNQSWSWDAVTTPELEDWLNIRPLP